TCAALPPCAASAERARLTWPAIKRSSRNRRSITGLALTQGMIENVVKIGAHLQPELFGHGEVFMDAEIDPPGARPREEVAPRDGRVIQQVGSSRRQRKCFGVEELIAR